MRVTARSAALTAAGRPHVVATVVWRRSPTSGTTGAKAIIHPDGTIEGWLGGACAEATVIRRALEALEVGRPSVLAIGQEDGREDVAQVAMACESEGAMEVFLDPMIPSPTVVALGRSPAAATLVRLADALGWETVHVEAPPVDLAGADERTFVVVASQGHFDDEALVAALRTEAAYIGLVASRKRHDAITRHLRAAGFGDHDLARIDAPAGIDLGTLPPEEMAVSILAQIVERKASGVSRKVVVTMPETAIDPVCGMEVDPQTAIHTSEHDGTTWYFCAAGCKRAFEADPGSFLES